MVLLTASCATTHEILLGDVISFGDDAITSYACRKGKTKNNYKQGSPYVLYTPGKGTNSSEQFKMQSRIYKTEMENNTAGIYAMDIALDRIKYIRKHQLKRDHNAKYYVIYMTDGLDNISVQVASNNKQGKYKNPDKYKQKMEKKIKKVSGCKKSSPNSFDIYPIVFTGTDLGAVKKENNMTDKEFDDFIDRNMGWMRGSSRGKEEAPMIIKSDNFSKVLEIFKEEFYASGFEFHVPKGYVGKEIRMSFSDDHGRKTELKGKLVKKGRKFFLKNIELNKGLESGVRLKNGKKLELTATNNKDKKAELAIFRLGKPKFKGTPYFIKTSLVEQSVNDGGIWVKNSEYISQSKGTIDTYFVLVFDASKSLGNEFEGERKTAMEMISIISKDVMNAEKMVYKAGQVTK